MGVEGLSCGSRFAKYTLFLFNVIFWICGAAILGVGIWVLVDKDALQILHIASLDADDSLVRASAIVMIVVGTFIFVTGFLGCCGAFRESSCMLCTYAVILVLILVLQIAAGITAAVFRDKITVNLGESMNKTVMIRYGTGGNEGATEAWDLMQVQFKCCGALTGPSEWQDSDWAPLHSNMTVPDTCCVLNNKDSQNPDPVNLSLCNLAAKPGANVPNADNYLHPEGCKPSLLKWIQNHAGILMGVAFGLAAVQVIGIILACCLRNTIKNSYEYV